MPTDAISYQSSGYFSPLIIDYLNEKTDLGALYHRFPTLENFEKQFLEKKLSFTSNSRKVLVAAIEKQYRSFEISQETQHNIQSLLDENTFTVTTGHQLNLFTGPLYFLYKIVNAINLSRELKANYPQQHFVPVYWMASEDHDFEEISFFNFKGKKIKWNRESAGPVGRFSTEGLDVVLEVFKKELGSGTHARELVQLFEKAYVQHKNLADATRCLANELFGRFGLVIVDGDERDLKREFAPFVKEELLYQKAHKEVQATVAKMKPYEIQVNPRAINLFYIEDNLRERIVLESGVYKVNHTNLQFSETEILGILEKSPEKFSPNVILRPLYQEAILPNLCYIGGGAEVAYWLQLKSYFESVNVPFPILLLRNSVLLCSEKEVSKADRLGLKWQDLFLKQGELIEQKTREISEFPIDLTIQREHLKNQFHYLHVLANQTDPSFAGAVKAQEAKQLNGLDHLEKRLLKAQKRKHEDLLQRMISLQNGLFPNQSLQERVANFSGFYLEFGDALVDQLIAKQRPLTKEFTIITLT